MSECSGQLWPGAYKRTGGAPPGIKRVAHLACRLERCRREWVLPGRRLQRQCTKNNTPALRNAHITGSARRRQNGLLWAYQAAIVDNLESQDLPLTRGGGCFILTRENKRPRCDDWTAVVGGGAAAGGARRMAGSLLRRSKRTDQKTQPTCTSPGHWYRLSAGPRR